MNLPAEFLDYQIQYQAQNTLPVAKTSGMRLASGTKAASVTATGTTFAAGTDVLASALEFTASGSNNYIVRIGAAEWFTNTAGAANFLHVNLDGADAGIICQTTFTATNQGTPCVAFAELGTIPAAGEHSVNVRLRVNSGTGTVLGGAGGAGVQLPIIVTLEVA